jgi:hypothetical protein
MSSNDIHETTSDSSASINSLDTLGNCFIPDISQIPSLQLDQGMTGNKSSKYKNSISNILYKQCDEIKNATSQSINEICNISKRRLKDNIVKHNNFALGFLSKPDRTPNILGFAESVFKKYGYEMPSSVKYSHDNNYSISNEFNVDVSICESKKYFDSGLNKALTLSKQHIKKSNVEYPALQCYYAQLNWLCDEYRKLGDEIANLENALSHKLDCLDKVNNRLSLIANLTNNEQLPELIEAYNKYSDKVFEDSELEKTYKKLVEIYKKWNICREILSVNNCFRPEYVGEGSLCGICLTEPIGQALVPCGHTYCHNCSKKISMFCYVCRTVIRERLRLYFS